MKYLLRFFSRFEEMVTGTLLVILVALLTCNIVGRLLFSISWAWMEEVIRIIFVYLVLLAVCMGVKYDAHIRITFFRDLFPKNIIPIANFLADLIWLVFSLTAFYFSLELIATMSRFVQLTPVLSLNLSKVYWIIPFCLGLTSLRIVERWVRRFMTRNMAEGGAQ